ncbi:hypothetical protein [Streptomyces sp. NPDC004682]
MTVQHTGQRQTWAELHNSFEFYHRYYGHDRFRVALTDNLGTFTYDVRNWSNMIRTVEAFTTTVALPGMALVAKVALYRTGEAELNGYVVRITPVV